MAVREPEIIEMYLNGKEYGTLTKAEISEHCDEMQIEELAGGWSSTCDYLSRFTDGEGLCRLDLETLVENGEPDYTRDAAVCVIIFTLINTGRGEGLPEELLERSMPYISARSTELEYMSMKLKRMENFALKALDELGRALDGDTELDKCYERILSYAPSPESYSLLKRRHKEFYLPLFEVMKNAARMCSSQMYAEALDEYIEALS